MGLLMIRGSVRIKDLLTQSQARGLELVFLTSYPVMALLLSRAVEETQGCYRLYRKTGQPQNHGQRPSQPSSGDRKGDQDVMKYDRGFIVMNIRAAEKSRGPPGSSKATRGDGDESLHQASGAGLTLGARATQGPLCLLLLSAEKISNPSQILLTGQSLSQIRLTGESLISACCRTDLGSVHLE
ncbi:hypothetical protein SKAU_G00079470 [Synaphobranchus kaupii]|uniref:Uncharacterized protein n=1 Tax=Synaphobranchus kaupii TaxID=118154 RepID=A0A9Q1FV16_SYNKA|nr:hypothetical protein SKAU_G00079470 [Synaphobranchus kaupii]